jgi:hypothetical protein
VARPATLPANIRVGLLQAGHDPSAGGRLGRVLVRGLRKQTRGTPVVGDWDGRP